MAAAAAAAAAAGDVAVNSQSMQLFNCFTG